MNSISITTFHLTEWGLSLDLKHKDITINIIDNEDLLTEELLIQWDSTLNNTLFSFFDAQFPTVLAINLNHGGDDSYYDYNPELLKFYLAYLTFKAHYLQTPNPIQAIIKEFNEHALPHIIGNDEDFYYTFLNLTPENYLSEFSHYELNTQSTCIL